jgi:quinol monooxygenase YgiN
MSSEEPQVGLLVPITAQLGKEKAIAAFLDAGLSLVPTEPFTLQWFGLQYADTSPGIYAIFDTFASPTGRTAHLQGQIAAALMQNAPVLLGGAPEINEIEVLASKVDTSVAAGAKGKTAGLSVGLRVVFEAKPEMVGAVREFLVGALPLVHDEPFTPVWYAIAFPGTNKFGIVDFFASEGDRTLHLAGKVAAALFANVDKLLTGAPDVVKVDVLAAKI